MKIHVADKLIDCEHLLGHFLNEEHYDLLVEEDMDCYAPPNCDVTMQNECDLNCNNCPRGTDENRVIFKFRKNFFSKELQDLAYEGLEEAAVTTENRGLASGVKEGMFVTGEGIEWVYQYQYDIMDAILENENPSLAEELYSEVVDPIEVVRKKYPTKESRLRVDGDKTSVWVISRVREKIVFDEWVDSLIPLSPAERVKKTKEIMKNISLTTYYGNKVESGIAGWFDRYPRIPYGRATSYTKNNFDKFSKSFSFLQKLNQAYKDLLPSRWKNQNEAASKIDKQFLVPETVFTTITVNRNFRTAAHRDAGDLHTGISNLLVLSNDGKYEGGYLILPEIRAAVNVRPGDLLLINNHQYIHGNTPIIEKEGSKRISLVCYFRENMLKLGEKEYEDYRFEFIESRRKNENHPLQRPLWNGISENCFSDSADKKQNWKAAKEWYDFLMSKPNGEKYLKDYHPWLKDYFSESSLFI